VGGCDRPLAAGSGHIVDLSRRSEVVMPRKPLPIHRLRSKTHGRPRLEHLLL